MTYCINNSAEVAGSPDYLG